MAQHDRRTGSSPKLANGHDSGESIDFGEAPDVGLWCSAGGRGGR